MSWSVRAIGNVAEVRGCLDEQFKGPLAGLSDDGERRTVEMLRDCIDQCLTTFDPAQVVAVSTYGHMSCSVWDQSLTVSIHPVL